MAIPNATKQSLADAWAALGSYVSLHTAAAGTTGANEASGGGYARVQTTWTAGTTGVDTGSAVNVSCAAGTYTEGGLWATSTAGTFRSSAAFSGGSIVVVGTGASITVTPSVTIN
jgi:hypothetical protein